MPVKLPTWDYQAAMPQFQNHKNSSTVQEAGTRRGLGVSHSRFSLFLN